MASNTLNLNLYKKDPATDGEDTFNIETMLNENWDKIDGKTQKNIIKATTAPTSPVADDLWLDTSASPNILKRFNGTTWIKIGETPPVTSVNNKTGAVALTAADVGAADEQTVSAHLANKASLTEYGHVMIGDGLSVTEGVISADIPEMTAESVSIADTSDNFTATNVEDALSELFTSGNDGKNLLETTLISKNATVSKAGIVATFSELNDGILQLRDALTVINFYDNGDENTDLTGGFDVGYSAGGGSQAKTSTALELSAVSSGSVSIRTYVTNLEIPLDSINTLFAEVTITQADASNAGAQIRLSKNKSGEEYELGYIGKNATGTHIMQIDVSALTGTCYVKLMATASNGRSAVLEFHKVWGEE